MLNIVDVNYLCQELSREEQEAYLKQQIDVFLEEQEELKNLELQKQYEMLSRSTDFEDFSPFDTYNS